MLIISACNPLPSGQSTFAPEQHTQAAESQTAGPTLSPQPGFAVRGCVRLASGEGVPGVKIYRAFASYSGEVVAVTGGDGCYQSEFQFIPGDEMVRVWAELDGYIFTPADESMTWQSGVYYWRHYHGFEEASLDFIAEPN